jgi:PXA domain
MERSSSTANLNRIFQHIKPQQLTSSELIDAELSKIITLILRDYISSWFSHLSIDDDFYAEIVKTLGQIVAEIEHRLRKIDWVMLLSQEFPNTVLNHLREHRQCSVKFGTAYAGGKSFQELFDGCQPHIALSSVEAEKEYLRRVTEIIIDTMGM